MMVCAVYLGGCAGSSSNTVAMNGGAGDSDGAGYNSDGAVASLSGTSASAFAPTAGEVHSSAASQAADVLTSVAKPGNAAYKIGPLDVLDISVFKVPDLTKEVQVAEDGTVNYPLIGDIPAAGRTAHELEQELRKKLGSKYLRDPQVTVLVKEYNSQRVTVSGAVKTSGVYAIKGSTSLMQVVAMAGDIDATVDSGNVVIFRTIDGQRSAAKFDIDDIKAGKAADPQVQPGDVIVVDSSMHKSGAAKRPHSIAACHDRRRVLGAVSSRIMNYNRPDPQDEGNARAGSVVPAAQYVPAARDPYNVGAYGAAAEVQSHFQLDLLEYLRIVVKRRWLILSIVTAAVVLGAVMTLMKTPLYTSTVRLQIDRNVAKIVEGGNITPIGGSDIEFMRTQYELLGGPTMAERVVSALNLGQDPTFFQPRQFSILGFIKGLIFSDSAAPAGQGSKKINNAGAAVGVVLAQPCRYPGDRFGAGGHCLFGSRSSASAKDRRGLCRRLHCLQSR